MTHRKPVVSVLYYTFLIALMLVYLLPIYLLLLTGFKPFDQVDLKTMWNLPVGGLYIDNFIAGYKQLAPNIDNSLKMVIPEALLSALLGSINGYLLAKWKFKGSNLLFSLILFGMFIPYQSILIPLVKFMQSINLYGDLPGLVMVHIIYGIPITTLIFRNYYAGISSEILEAGRIDGASLLGLYRYIMFPLSAPSFAVVIIWQFTQAWNEFLFAVVLTNQSNWPVTVALNNLAGSQLVQWNVLMAATFMAALPTMLVYIFLGRFFLRGLMAGALKE
ncbi:carbohydrate ABC transporter permease [Leptolinea tardivitalis]|nr:carbohydrate ABC transporter permease [Leptolinea tardivitalis]GAP21536.1 carbohydrate ABC transporter membrane protein 2, CUT1 family [Leptolinea tardivitalis]